MSDTTTELMKAIAEIRDSFPMGSESWWDCLRWHARALEIEREMKMPMQIPDRHGWYKRYMEILQLLSDMPASKFTAGELAWLTNEIYGPVRLTNDDQGAQILEQCEYILKKKLADSAEPA